MSAERKALPDGIVVVRNAHGREFIDVRHPAVAARIALEGGQIVACTPAGQRPLLWMSPADPELPGKPLRGGIPICWPWFAGDRSGPAHGIARTSPWQLAEADTDPRQVRLVLTLPEAEIERQLPGERWQLSVAFVLGRTLSVTLITTNIGDRPRTLSQALHTYLPVSDIHRARLEGLDGCAYVDKVTGVRHNIQRDAVVFTGEMDRIYHGYHAPVRLIEDAGASITVNRGGSRSLVVWNPWMGKAATLGNFPPDGYCTMVCVEAANAGPDARTLAPGESHTLGTDIARA